MADLLQQAIERRNALRRELEALDRFIADYGPAVRAEKQLDLPTNADLFDMAADKPSRSERAATVARMMDDAEQIILATGRPMTRSQLLARLTDGGHRIDGGDQSKVLGTNIWRSRRFHNILGAGYWPKSAPIPEAFKRFTIRDSMLSA
ncbi:hypothetical protein FPZ24_14530 [Sphingomonas panacisoli]|uniref:Uncharacterized protein n=1 Tax=Sphingomonas panacisoli TaxID=1813879 RepID=A0A5B8LLG4_9SPHN|nr:hypothetical protein [Sphingomonas panacisoli]QDZ08535.1 hypothetical protein FPZ24_14530 [Sphingomonas panacisoli]